MSNLNFRYTGEFPPPEVLAQFSNWDYALEEVPGQDMTTLKPEDEQSTVTEWTAFTAGDVRYASNTVYPAMIEVIDSKVAAVCILLPKGRLLRVVFNVPTGKWIPYVEDWLPKDDRHYGDIDLRDPSIFPLRVTSRLPFAATGKPWRAEIRSDGSEGLD